jgi:hypothetical protein
LASHPWSLKKHQLYVNHQLQPEKNFNLPKMDVASPQSSKLSPHKPNVLIDTTNQPMQNYDGTEMRDANSRIVYKSQFLSTHPLKEDCKEKPGFGENN